MQTTGNKEVEARIAAQIRHNLGTEVLKLLEDKSVFELMVNGDGLVWSVSMAGKTDTGIIMPPQQRLAFLGTIASLGGKELNERNAIVDGMLPWDGSRVSGRIPPVDIHGASFNIRKKAIKVFTLDEYVAQGRVTEAEKELICRAVREKQNILVAGPTGSGKTTFTNAILHSLYEIAPNERIFAMEDTIELQILQKDSVRLKTSEYVDLQDLIRNAMRGSPERIIIGEVRDGSALDLLKSWNTGHPGGVTTLHANSCKDALNRLEMLISERTASPMQRLIADAIGTVFYIQKVAGIGPALTEIMEVIAYDKATEDYRVKWIKKGFMSELSALGLNDDD